MPSTKFRFGFSILILILISSCSLFSDLFSSASNNSPIPPPAFTPAAIPSSTVTQTISLTVSSSVSPTDSQPLSPNYFGFPYDPSVWTLVNSDQENIPPSLAYISDSYCSTAVNSNDSDKSVFIMVDKEIVLGKHTWTRRYFLDNHNAIVFEVYLTEEYPDNFYNQLAEGNYISTGGIRLLGLYETCRQATQQILAGMP